MKDYTDAQTRPVPFVDGLPGGRQSERISEKGQRFYAQTYGARPKDVHIVTTAGKQYRWFISPERRRFISAYPHDRSVFIKINNMDTPEETIKFVGWLFHYQVSNRSYAKPPFQQMELFRP